MENKDVENVDGYGVINYRLAAIEQQLKDLTQLLIKVPIMNNDIKDVTKRVSDLEALVKINTTDIQELKTAPNKDKANKWEHYSSIIFDLVITAAVVIVLIKIGLK